MTAPAASYETNDELHFHNDGGDAFMLLCVRAAQEGGMSKLVSMGAAVQRMLRRRPTARVAQQPFHFDSRSQNAAEKVQVVPSSPACRATQRALQAPLHRDRQRFPEVRA